MKTYSLSPGGSLVITETVLQPDQNKVMVENTTRTEIQPEQIAKFRRDPEFDAALPPDIKAALDAVPV